MKTFIHTVVIIGCFVTCLYNAVAQELKVSVPSATVQRGGKISVPIRLSGGNGSLASVDVVLRYNARLLAVVSARAGTSELMTCITPATTDNFGGDIEQALVTVTCGATRLSDGTLCFLELEGLAGPDSLSNFTPVEFKVNSVQPANVTFESGVITVQGVPPVAPIDADILFQNAPNPFRQSTTFRYSLADDSQVDFAIYTSTGKLVRTLPSEQRTKGTHSFDFVPTSDERQGVYFLQMRTARGVYNVPFVIGPP